MQNKSEPELPPEVQVYIARSVSNHDIASLARISKYHLALFKPMLDVSKLLHHVTRGEHDAVKAILTLDNSLIFKRGRVTDCSGREFGNISAFEYVLWALDKHMWTAMIACIPQSKTMIFEKLIAQYIGVVKYGVTYKLNKNSITEQHFDFENTIIKELQTQMQLINKPGYKYWGDIDKQWRAGVGEAEKLAPMHVVYEFCSKEPFFPVPEFKLQPESSRQYYNWTTRQYEDWFSLDSTNFAIYKGCNKSNYGSMAAPGRAGDPCSQDLRAMIKLWEVRTQDFINLEYQLEEQKTLSNPLYDFQV